MYSFVENKIEQCFIDNQWFVFEKLNINCTVWDLGCYFGGYSGRQYMIIDIYLLCVFYQLLLAVI